MQDNPKPVPHPWNGSLKVSIVTITFNSAKTLADTIESVMMQDYPNIEYIIVDGQSRDNTVGIIEQYADKMPIKWVSEPDKGLYDAMNKGIKMATGDIVGIINSDDFYHRKDAISKIVQGFNDGKTDCVFADIRFVGPDNLNKTTRYYSARNFTPNKFKWGFMPPHPTFFVKRGFFEKLGYYQTDYYIAADYELLIRFLYKNKLRYRYLPFDLMKMRTGGRSTASLKSNWILNKEIVRACKENGINTNLFFLYSKYFKKVFELINTKNKN